MTYPRDVVVVDPAALSDAGAKIRYAGLQVSAALTPTHQDAVEPVGDGQGWTTWDTLRTAGQQWIAELQTLATLATNTGSTILRAARGYQDADDSSARDIGRRQAV